MRDYPLAEQPDEGYSEEPIVPAQPSIDPITILSTLQSSADLSTWLKTNSSLLPLRLKKELTLALLDEFPTSTIAEIVRRLHPRLYIDFIQYLPAEICVKILSYLEPTTLVSVMRTCRAWCSLALDRKVWERLYYMEGWQAVYAQIEAQEREINAEFELAQEQHRQEGPSTKKRALSGSDEDAEMTDLDGSVVNGNGYFTIRRRSSDSLDDVSQSRRWQFGALDDTYGEVVSTSKGKSVERSDQWVSSPGKRKEHPSDDFPTWLESPPPSGVKTNSEFIWDSVSKRFRVNWKWLYNMRRKLESNWELAKFITFQLPHPSHSYEGHSECIYTVQFDPNYVVSGSRDRTMRVWNMQTQRLIRVLKGHKGSVLCLQFDADPEEDIIVSGSSDSNIFIWKFSTGELLQKITKAHAESVLNVRFDKRVLVTSSKDKTIKVFNRKPLHYGELGYGTLDSAVDPVANNIKRYGYDMDLSGEMPIKPAYTMISRLNGHAAAVNAIQIRDSKVVSVSGDRTVKVWNWPTGLCTRTIPAHSKGIACVEYDGRRIVSGSSDHLVCVFDALTGVKVATLQGHSHLVRTVQADFGDHPYSQYEDEQEARAIDEKNMHLLQNRDVDPEADRAARRERRRRRQAGTSQAEDVESFGAKLPPGGGGGRRYGRIVSGSYDQNIIVWRRDKEGVWKAAYHLRQENAADAAQQRALQLTDSHPLLAGSHGMDGASNAPFTSHQPQLLTSPGYFMVLLSHAMPMGPGVLLATLLQNPGVMDHLNFALARIEQEPSPEVRTNLWEVVATCDLLRRGAHDQRRAAVEQIDALLARYAHENPRPQNYLTLPPHLQAQVNGTFPGNGASSANGAPASSLVATAGSDADSAASSVSENADGADQATPTVLPAAGASSAEAVATPGASVATAVISQSTLAPPITPAQHHQLSPTQNTIQLGLQPPPQSLGPLPTTMSALASTPIGGPPTAGGIVHPDPTENASGLETIQPHGVRMVGQPPNQPGRIFKLQFDARRLVCCSQASIIVGWDYCNGDSELEEAAKYFAMIE